MGKKIMKHLFTLIALIAVGGAAFFGWKIIETELRNRREQEDINEIYEMMQAVTAPDSQNTETKAQSSGTRSDSLEESAEAGKSETKEEPIVVRTPEELLADSDRMLAQYAALYGENTDLVGWIMIDNTVINYPVMHTPNDPDFYLHRNFRKEEASSGMIYIDGNCHMDGTSRNLLIYGHHMRNGAMFASLQKYDSKSYYLSHPYVMFNTLDETAVYQVVAAFKQPAATVDESFKNMLLAETDEEFSRLLAYANAHRFYDTGVAMDSSDRLITLTTCEYTQGDGRFFVIAKKIMSESGK